MKVQEAKRSVRIQGWATEVSDRRQSGMTVKEWCSVQGYSVKTYYYRLKRVREEWLEAAESGNSINLQEKPVFAALPMPQTKVAAVTVRLNGCSVEILNGADATVIRQVLQAVSRL